MVLVGAGPLHGDRRNIGVMEEQKSLRHTHHRLKCEGMVEPPEEEARISSSSYISLVLAA